MRVVTWNVNSLKMRMPRVLEFIELHRPDVLLLQETKAPQDAFPDLELADAGYHAVHHSAGQWAGVAVVARSDLPLEDPALSLSGDPVPEEARWCEATVDGIRMASVYVPNGRTLDSPEYPRKLAFLDAMAARISELRSRLAGDRRGRHEHRPGRRRRLRPAGVRGRHARLRGRARPARAQILDGGMVDAYRAVHPDEVQYTWWDYRAGHFHKGFGLRIDLALLSTSLAERLTACGIDRNFRKGKKPSDHAPLMLELS